MHSDLVVGVHNACAYMGTTTVAEKAEKEAAERRVYVLPAELVQRIRDYQEAQAIPSEVEAVRRLLDAALQMRDDVFSIITKLRTRSQTEKDLRILSRDVLATHPLVREIRINDAGLTFKMQNGDAGRIGPQLDTYHDASGGFGDTQWKLWPEPEPEGPFGRGARSSDGTSKSTLDDDIPF